jgi:hypothetical protein
VESISPVNAGLPEARSAVTVLREWSGKKIWLTPKSQCSRPTHTRFPIQSGPEGKITFHSSGRGHWSIEKRNHHKRDASARQEDRHRHRRPKAAQNLALTRSALLAIIPFEPGQPLAQFFEFYHRHPNMALQLILHSRPVL